jgi:hypothetical protein
MKFVLQTGRAASAQKTTFNANKQKNRNETFFFKSVADSHLRNSSDNHFSGLPDGLFS